MGRSITPWGGIKNSWGKGVKIWICLPYLPTPEDLMVAKVLNHGYTLKLPGKLKKKYPGLGPSSRHSESFGLRYIHDWYIFKAPCAFIALSGSLSWWYRITDRRVSYPQCPTCRWVWRRKLENHQFSDSQSMVHMPAASAASASLENLEMQILRPNTRPT